MPSGNSFLQPPFDLRSDCHRQSGMEIASLSPSQGGLVRCIFDGAYRRVRDAARYERVHTAGGKVAAPTK